MIGVEERRVFRKLASCIQLSTQMKEFAIMVQNYLNIETLCSTNSFSIANLYWELSNPDKIGIIS